jgi:hypothetical protein
MSQIDEAKAKQVMSCIQQNQEKSAKHSAQASAAAPAVAVTSAASSGSAASLSTKNGTTVNNPSASTLSNHDYKKFVK